MIILYFFISSNIPSRQKTEDAFLTKIFFLESSFLNLNIHTFFLIILSFTF